MLGRLYAAFFSVSSALFLCALCVKPSLSTQHRKPCHPERRPAPFAGRSEGSAFSSPRFLCELSASALSLSSLPHPPRNPQNNSPANDRSEERRVGKECRSR